MNSYKFIFEKTFSDRCISKKIEHEIIIESELNINQKSDLSELGYSKLISEYPIFFTNTGDLKSAGWSNPKIKEIFLLTKP